MKIFSFFYSEKIIFHKNKKNSIIAQQEEKLKIYTTRDDNGRVWDGAIPSDPTRLFFSILKLVSFKKLNRAGKEMRKFPNSHRLILIFVFFLNFNCFIFSFFIILKLIFFIKIKIL